MRDYKINDFITLKLKGNKTIIYIKGIEFIQCMRLVLNISKKDIERYNDVDSIDDAMEVYDKYLYENTIVDQVDQLIEEDSTYLITPEQEFEAHCSNIQTWVEHDYNTKILSSDLSFPLLKKLTEVGDPKAKKVFREEIAERMKSSTPSVVEFLINEGYLDYFNADEYQALLDELNESNIDYLTLDGKIIQPKFLKVYQILSYL